MTFLTGSDPAGTTTTNAYAQNSKSWSIFTHNTFDITDRLNVTLGLRWSDESKDGSFTQPANNNPTCNGFLANGSANLVTAIATAGVPAAAIPTVAGGLAPTAFGLSCLAFLAPADSPAAAVLPLPRTFDSTFKDDELIYTAKVGTSWAMSIYTPASPTDTNQAASTSILQRQRAAQTRASYRKRSTHMKWA